MVGEDHNDNLADMWTVKLDGVKRLEAADPEDKDEIYMIEFELESPSAKGCVEIMVGGGDNETLMIAQARETLQPALERWARVMIDQSNAERCELAKG